MVNTKRKKITPEVVSSFLEGNDPQERIVNLDYSGESEYITIYYRDENDNKCIGRQPFYPFLWAKRDVCVNMCGGNRQYLKSLMNEYSITVKELDCRKDNGEICEEIAKDGYVFMFYSLRPMSYYKFLEFFKRTGFPVYAKSKGNKNSFTNVSVSKKEDSRYLCPTPKEQFLISTGKRFFKGYEDYDDVLRMIFDLETTGLDTKKDRIEQIGIRFNRPVKYKGKYINFERIYTVEGETEEEKNISEIDCIDKTLRVIYTFMPDVITAHNGETFDWNMFIGACERLGTSFEKISAKYFGGTGIKKDKRESILKLGGEIETYNKTLVPGIIVTDSLHAVRRAQALDSNMLFSNLKYVTKYSKIVKVDRVYVPGDKISTIWNDTANNYAFCMEDGDWYIVDKNYADSSVEFKKGKQDDKFTLYTRNYLADGYQLVNGRYIVTRYLLDDLWECDKVEHRYNIPNFLICKMLPVPYDRCCTMGTAGQWKSLLMAWSYENDLAIPPFNDKKKFTGGLSRLLKVGFVSDVAKFDYNSLYPAIILTWAISDDKDLMNVMLYFLEYVLTQREKYKKLKKAAKKKADAIKEQLKERQYGSKEEGKILNAEMMKWKQEESANDKKQLPLKILGNSFFGSYGAPNVFNWASIDCAERTTCTGRQALRLMICKFHDLGYEPIVGDTDGFNFKLPTHYRYTKENPYIGKGLSRETEEGKEYIEFKADVAEFNDLYMRDFHYSENATNKMGLGIDEIVDSTINFSRKNYADYFPDEPFPDDVKMVGNTIKSKKMPEYISKFLEQGIRLLLQGKGKEFLDAYYAYIEKIFNCQIPLKQIASKGKVKKSIKEYLEDCKTLTKAGRPKSKQAWMELAIKNNLDIHMGETIYYINTGKSKSQADIKSVKHYYTTDPETGAKIENRVRLEKEWKQSPNGKLSTGKKKVSMDEYVRKYHPEVMMESEVVLNCVMLSNDVIESENDVFCADDFEYNIPKYVAQFNSRIKPLLVCFNPDIRDYILIKNPSERPCFTDEQCKLDSGNANRPGDQDTYEQLMSMEDKEIKFWLGHPQWKIPFLEECGMDWDKITEDYFERKKREKELGIDIVREQYEKAIDSLTSEDIAKFIDDGEIPSDISAIVDIDVETDNFVAKEYPDIIIGSIRDIIEAAEYLDEDEYE